MRAETAATAALADELAAAREELIAAKKAAASQAELSEIDEVHMIYMCVCVCVSRREEGGRLAELRRRVRRRARA